MTKEGDGTLTAEPKGHHYDATSIQVLEGLDAVRKRPAMYIGDIGTRGLHHLVYEVVDNSVDEALAGFCTQIDVAIETDNSITVIDDGRGIPVDMHATMKKPALEVVMTTLHAGGKFDSKTYKVSGGLHGVGVSVVNALSEWCEVEVLKDGKVYSQRYEQGKPVGTMTSQPAEKGRKGSGTTTRFRPDAQIFTEVEFHYDTLAARMRELAFLNSGLTIKLTDRRSGKTHDFLAKGGIVEFVKYLNQNKDTLHSKIISFARERDRTSVEVALQYNDTYQESVHSFVNNINTIEGGTHLIGFRSALTRSITNYAEREGMTARAKVSVTGEDVREGLTAVISIKMQDPQFEGQTKTKLGNSELKGIVESIVGEGLREYFEENPPVVRKIIDKMLAAARAREAARKARELARRKTILDGGALPGKLADCAWDNPEDCELFIVEGDSAGGCFSGDTRVALADGRSLSFEELVAEQAEGEQHYGYTIRRDGRVGLERLVHARCTKRRAEAVRLTLDNGESIVCTPDHRFMLRDGSYKAAMDLDASDSLMPLSRTLSDRGQPEITIDGYEMTWDLASLAKAQWSDPALRQWRSLKTREQWSAEFRARRRAALESTYYRRTMAALKQIHMEHGRVDLDAYQSQRLATRDRMLLRFDRFCQRYFDGDPARALEAAVHYNHRVVKIERLSERVDVYDLEVPSTHNFALASGVFVHNSAKQGRDRRFQAILPIRGKILNVEKARIDKILGNEEIRNVFTALGTGVGDDFDIGKLRYHRIILMADADVDGAHIRTLLLTLIFRKLPELVDKGHIYIAQPPLFLVKAGKEEVYCYNDKEREEAVARMGKKNVQVQRYKGLGEMNPEQLWRTTMNRETRTLLQVKNETASEAERIFSILMGEQVEPRRQFIEENALSVRNLDV
jgi:DNA gyrase subunit B